MYNFKLTEPVIKRCEALWFFHSYKDMVITSLGRHTQNIAKFARANKPAKGGFAILVYNGHSPDRHPSTSQQAGTFILLYQYTHFLLTGIE